jgi:hypothetical protein
MALVNTREKKFLLLTAVFTGLAMLSKYTAVTLFLFYGLFLFFKIIFDNPEGSLKNSAYRRSAGDFLSIFLIFALSLGVFSVFLPAVFAKSRYLTKGLSQFMPISHLAAGISIIVSVLVFLNWKKDYLEIIWKFLAKYKKFLLHFSVLLFLGIIFAVIANVWSGQKFAPFDTLRDAAYANEPKKFDFRPFLPREDSWIKSAKIFFMEFYPFVFSLTPLSFFLLIFFSVQILRGKIRRIFMPAAASIFLFFVFYFSSTLLVRVVTNVRYSIIIYPLFAYLSAIAFLELRDTFGRQSKNFIFFAGSIVLISGIWAAWNIRPFYFNYTNFLLPKKFTIHHSWGHGSYEAAQFLNSLPDSKNLVVWSNTATFCPFFEGRCIYSRRIDLNIVRPDYLVISRRGELKAGKRFVYKNDSGQNEKSPDYYFEKLQNDYAWKLEIDNRPKNYVKIVKFEK